MRLNVYAEEMSEDVEIISKEIEGETFTGVRFYLYLPVTTTRGNQVRGKFMHKPDDDDSSAVTFWGKKDLRKVLLKALEELDKHHKEISPAKGLVLTPEYMRCHRRGRYIPPCFIEDYLIPGRWKIPAGSKSLHTKDRWQVALFEFLSASWLTGDLGAMDSRKVGDDYKITSTTFKETFTIPAHRITAKMVSDMYLLWEHLNKYPVIGKMK